MDTLTHLCGGVNSAIYRVLSVGVFLLAVWRIIGRGTSVSAMPTICIRCLMSLLSGQPNWVRDFNTFIACVGLLLGVISLRFLNCFGFRVRLIGVCSMVMLFRTTSMAETWEWPNSIRTCDPHHLHADASPCGNVLQVGFGRGLLQSPSSHASV